MFSYFFIDRPIFAAVLSIVITIVGGIALLGLPIAQYPEVTPPTVSVTATYPGANASVVADTVAFPIEQQVNGVEGMLYMSSRCTNDGAMSLDVTFKLGTNLDMAQVLVQNRVAIAEAKLPEEVRRTGVTVKKKSPSILLVINLFSPDQSKDQLYLSNYATIQIRDELSRVQGVGDVTVHGGRDYSMRVWLDPNQLAARNLSASDVVKAIQEQNVQVAAGRVGAPPAPKDVDYQLTVNAQGRLLEREEFAEIIIKTGDRGEVTRMKDVARVELGAQSYEMNSYLDGKDCVTILIFQLPGANALQTAEDIRAAMTRMEGRFPQGVAYGIYYDTTQFIEESVRDVVKTLFEAFALVFLVVLVFLQTWRATIIPMVAVPVSLIGTFAVMALLGFSLNNLSLFGLVLAIGIVVDDAIVVVENVERNLALGLSPRDATRKAMTEVSGPVIAVALVLSAVFVPTAFIAGITGQFYRQFALTIAASTIISAFNSLTLSPALCRLLLKGHGEHGAAKEAFPRLGLAIVFALLFGWWLGPVVAPLLGRLGLSESARSSAAVIAAGAVGILIGLIAAGAINWILGRFFAAFNWAFDRGIGLYGRAVALCLTLSVVMLLAYAGILGLTYLGFKTVPAGFIPEQDKGYIFVNAQLPDGASLERSDVVVKELIRIVDDLPGVAHTVAWSGWSLVTSANLPNVATVIGVLEPFEERRGDPSKSANAALRGIFEQTAAIQDAFIIAFGAPAVDGLGTTGGFKLQVEDRSALGFDALQGMTQNLIEASTARFAGMVGDNPADRAQLRLFSGFRAAQPQLYLDIDRTKAKAEGVALSEIFSTLQVYLGSAYVNDFTAFNRNWQVNVQADAAYRLRPEDIGTLKVRNADGAMVPLGSVVTVRDVVGPSIVYHYNLYPSADINGSTPPSISSGQQIAVLDEVAGTVLPRTMGYEWTDLSLQQILAGNTAGLVFALGTVFVFLVLAAQYESWTLPLAIILIVPMCLSAAIAGVALVGSDNNIFTQIGLIVLIGLASKNAILIVEFAKEKRETEGLTPRVAAIEAAKLRLRPILMTSFAFILGVVPLVLAQGAGAEMRRALGVTVFSGMLGVTLFGIFFTPVFFSLIESLTGRRATPATPTAPAPESVETPASATTHSWTTELDLARESTLRAADPTFIEGRPNSASLPGAADLARGRFDDDPDKTAKMAKVD